MWPFCRVTCDGTQDFIREALAHSTSLRDMGERRDKKRCENLAEYVFELCVCVVVNKGWFST